MCTPKVDAATPPSVRAADVSGCEAAAQAPPGGTGRSGLGGTVTVPETDDLGGHLGGALLWQVMSDPGGHVTLDVGCTLLHGREEVVRVGELATQCQDRHLQPYLSPPLARFESGGAESFAVVGQAGPDGPWSRGGPEVLLEGL